jgi:4-hydroxy-2-oxoheptanedioate aldolase
VTGGFERLASRWSRGEAVVGTWASIGSTFAAELLAAAGPDYVAIDGQHGLAGPDGIVEMLGTLRHLDPVPMVRVSKNDPSVIGRALDAGAEGVIVPLVGSAEQARAAVAACRYPPHGRRSFGAFRGSSRFGATLAQVDAGVLCLAMIETREGVDALDDISAVPGITGIYVGPSDLAIDLGFDRATSLDERGFGEVLGAVVDACARHDVVAGVHAGGVEEAVRFAALGFRMITVCSDSGLLRNGAARAVSSVRQRVTGDGR